MASHFPTNYNVTIKPTSFEAKYQMEQAELKKKVKNREAARKHRTKEKAKAREVQEYNQELEKDKHKLQIEVDCLTKLEYEYRTFLLNHSTSPYSCRFRAAIGPAPPFPYAVHEPTVYGIHTIPQAAPQLLPNGGFTLPGMQDGPVAGGFARSYFEVWGQDFGVCDARNMSQRVESCMYDDGYGGMSQMLAGEGNVVHQCPPYASDECFPSGFKGSRQAIHHASVSFRNVRHH